MHSVDIYWNPRACPLTALMGDDTDCEFTRIDLELVYLERGCLKAWCQTGSCTNADSDQNRPSRLVIL
jgi:hypothetical protein